MCFTGWDIKFSCCYDILTLNFKISHSKYVSIKGLFCAVMILFFFFGICVQAAVAHLAIANKVLVHNIYETVARYGLCFLS